jgi:hypothetical protein
VRSENRERLGPDHPEVLVVGGVLVAQDAGSRFMLEYDRMTGRELSLWLVRLTDGVALDGGGARSNGNGRVPDPAR